ncbi:hypothetical protein CONCODRAFT_9285 [Conidiobolus coronatus NRRL 28638]|uniref:Uncharacterized protein n=1 Tax=Conidiobolus coronatus (strain ATCC 28846 / CBS 209.66 / NRRL 28638) TaxID=796925 RepID=A0A137P0S0_CONC2|nr:hypothetical protein CONCODRAFT_9285 [Conidiobolus coronatus NRRL 28638]|eukprot:KXN68439.1 hypothetical protein CONCODRAFT_9285 [Conidiobolus coronatus NRRL 28638]
MKFITIATSALACSSIFASPVNHQYKSNESSVDTTGVNSTAASYGIDQYFNADQIYDKLQEIAKIPKDEFVEKVNEGVSKIQKYINVGVDFFKRLGNLTDDQKQQLDALWTQVAPKYQQPLPTDPEQLKELILPDLKQFMVIFYQMSVEQTIINIRNYINS